MRYYEILDPINPEEDDFRPRVLIQSEKTILDYYYLYWCDRMVKAGKEDQISEDNYLDDWVVVNWANYIGDF